MTREELLGLLGQTFFTIRWAGDAVELIDQRLLPGQETYILVRTVDGMIEAIRTMAVRGAPAIGIAGAMGVALSVLEAERSGDEDTDRHVRRAAQRLENARPTAVNLRWAVRRTLARWEASASLRPEERKKAVVGEAEAVLLEDIDMCRRMGERGQTLVPDGATLMTLCNAGALATGGHGTALSVMRAARRAGKSVKVVACETRPLLQGARLTAWELVRDGFDVTLICDSAAGHVMAAGKIDAVFVGSDRVARSGDCANKIGTYMLGLLAGAHGVPFYVVVPSSTLDPDAPDGKSIVIEERDPEEVTCPAGVRTAPDGVRAANPAFDVTPASLVTRIVTEKGIYLPREVMASLK
jgi:methylthioribose-1-phosphate isomerase